MSWSIWAKEVRRSASPTALVLSAALAGACRSPVSTLPSAPTYAARGARADPTPPTAVVRRDPSAVLEDFEAGSPVDTPHPSIDALAADNTLITPVQYLTTVHHWKLQPTLGVTATLVTLASPASALATYNGWFARYGFMPAVERVAVSMGDQAELLELGWPPLHALIARTGERFLLVEADPALPPELRTAALLAVGTWTLPRDG